VGSRVGFYVGQRDSQGGEQMVDVMKPRPRTFGDRIKLLWQRLEKPAAFALVVGAFLLQSVGLALNQPIATSLAAVLLSLGLVMIISLVAEIHTKVVTPDSEREYRSFDSLRDELKERLWEVAKGKDSQETVDVRLIGMTLRRQWDIVAEFLGRLANEKNHAKIAVTMVALDPEWTDLESLNPRMPTVARGVRASLDLFRKDYDKQLSSGRWIVSVQYLQEFPLVCGMLIDRNHLYRTFGDAEKSRRISQGQSLYEYFEYREPGRKFDHDTVEHFERLFAYYTRSDCKAPQISTS